MVKNPPAMQVNAGSIPGMGRLPGEGNGNPLQCSCLENPMDRGAWCVRVGVVVKSWTRLNDFHFFSGQFVPLIFLTCLSTFYFLSVQVSSVVQSYSILCNLMDCSTPGFPVHCQLLEFTQTHVHSAGDAIQPSHPLSFPFPPTFNLSKH